MLSMTERTSLLSRRSCRRTAWQHNSSPPYLGARPLLSPSARTSASQACLPATISSHLFSLQQQHTNHQFFHSLLLRPFTAPSSGCTAPERLERGQQGLHFASQMLPAVLIILAAVQYTTASPLPSLPRSSPPRHRIPLLSRRSVSRSVKETAEWAGREMGRVRGKYGVKDEERDMQKRAAGELVSFFSASEEGDAD